MQSITTAPPTETAELSIRERALFDKLDGIVVEGREMFVRVGNALATIRDDKLYRETYGTFERYLFSRGLKRQRAYELIAAAQVVMDLSEISDIPPVKNESHAAALADVPPGDRAVVLKLAEMNSGGRITARAIDEAKFELPHVAHNSGCEEWFTPPDYLDAARDVLGNFDLDPASCDVAQQNVQAATYHTRDDDGLRHDWCGRVFLNPPYTTGKVEAFTGKLLSGFEAGDVTAALLLVNNSTDSRWFQQAASRSAAICFPAGRVKFVGPAGEIAKPLQGQACLYFGPEPAKFIGRFQAFGFCIARQETSR